MNIYGSKLNVISSNILYNMFNSNNTVLQVKKHIILIIYNVHDNIFVQSILVHLDN